MSNTGRDANLIADDVQENYERVRLERGQSWDEMADQFTRDRSPSLAAWARARAAGVAEPAVRFVDDQAAVDVPRGRRRSPRRRVVPPTPETAAAAAAGAVDVLDVPGAAEFTDGEV